MKRVGYLYQEMLDTRLISYCWDQAIRGKRNRWDVRGLDKDTCVENIYKMLLERTFEPAVPRIKRIYDKSSQKQRDISVVPFYPDGVIQNIVVTVLRPTMEKHMYPWTCASIPGRGIHLASDKMKRLLRNRNKTKYCLKMDIRHYYPSVDRDVLMKKLERKVKDREFLDLIRRILDKHPEPGLAIGFYLSQWLSNFYLEDIDWKISELPGVYGYVRYMDDMVVLGPNKRKLHRAKDTIEELLREDGLTLKRDWQIFPVDARPVDFVGYRFGHGYTVMRRKLSLRLMRQSRRVEKGDVSTHTARSYLSRVGWTRHCDSRRFQLKYVNTKRIRELKEVVRRESERQREAEDLPR